MEENSTVKQYNCRFFSFVKFLFSQGINYCFNGKYVVKLFCIVKYFDT